MDEPPLLPTEEQKSEATMEREWRAQRLGWLAMALVVVAALAGLFGAGPLSWSSETASDGSVEVSFQRL